MVADTKLYDTLSVKPEATQDEIKKAYRKKAIATHPDKNKGNSKAEEQFKEVGQAYEILSDPEKRSAYDNYGYDYIVNGGQAAGPPPGAGAAGGFEGFPGFGSGGFPGATGGGMPGGGTRTFHFSTGGGGGGGGAANGFNFSDANDIFANFFKAHGGMGEDDTDPLGGGFNPSRPNFGTSRSNRYREPRRAATPEVQAVEKDLVLTLEQLYSGCTKKLKINRKVFDGNGKRKTEEKVLEVQVKPGFKDGTKIKFKGWGDQEEGGGVQDLHFIIKHKPHERFTREGDNLRTKVEIDLKEALTSWQRTITTIDGRQIRVSAGTPTQPGREISYPEQGMPKSKKPGERGDLVVEVKVKFPSTLTQQQKTQLAQIL